MKTIKENKHSEINTLFSLCYPHNVSAEDAHSLFSSPSNYSPLEG